MLTSTTWSGLVRLGRAIIGNSAQKVIDGFFASIGTQMGAIVTPVPAA